MGRKAFNLEHLISKIWRKKGLGVAFSRGPGNWTRDREVCSRVEIMGKEWRFRVRERNYRDKRGQRHRPGQSVEREQQKGGKRAGAGSSKGNWSLRCGPLK